MKREFDDDFTIDEIEQIANEVFAVEEAAILEEQVEEVEHPAVVVPFRAPAVEDSFEAELQAQIGDLF